MPSQTEVFGFVVGLLTAIVLLPVAVVVLWPPRQRIHTLPAPRKSSFHRAEAAAWLEREGFVRLCAQRHGSRLSGLRPIEVFHHPGLGIFAFLGDGPTGRPSVRLMSRCSDGHVVDTIASPEGDEQPANEPDREQAFARHQADLAAAAAAGHGPAQTAADSEIARQLAAMVELDPTNIAELRTRLVVGQVFLWPALGGFVLALTSGWPWKSCGDLLGPGFRGLFVLALASNIAFELWFWRPWAKKVVVVPNESPRVPGTSAVRLDLESAGFVLLGQKTERARRAPPCDVYAHEAERAWANVSADQARGIYGYFLSTFANGASVITWTCQVPRKEGQLTAGWGAGFAKAWQVHRAAVSRLGDTHGALERCQSAEDREKATLAYYRAGWA
ncbi:MAG TPA: hypothetical protein VGK67_34710 [Myxococcales bacterium]|jgi:hypothetical protein